MWYRRLVSIPLILAVCCASIPAPANAATSTATEISIGKELDKQILATTNVVADPLLNSWVNGISEPLFVATARKDVPYSIKILDVPDVNAFSTLGGFVYLDVGTLDFVQSDDELAGVIGHETGHIERRHALENQSKAGVLSMLFGIGSLFSAFLYQFGSIFEGGIMAKVERQDEYQADKYGLMLMTRAGYDPDGMVSFMRHLGAYADQHNTLLDRYYADHPDTPKRVAALVGYPEIDPTVRTQAQRLAAAIHDQEEARYAIAQRDFAAILQAEPHNTVAQYHLGETQLALGASATGEQNLAQAAAAGSPETRTLAGLQIAALRASEGRLNLLHVDVQPLRARLAAAQLTQAQATTAITVRRDAGRDAVKKIQDREEQIAYGIPNLAGAQAKPGTRLDTMLRNVSTMSRALDTTVLKSQTALNGVGSGVRNRDGGLLRNGADVLTTMAAQLNTAPIPPQVLSTLPLFPRMVDDLAASDADMVRAVDAARAALAVLDLALGDLNRFVHELQRVHLSHGDIIEGDYHSLEPPMTQSVDAINRAAVVASQAAQLYNMARAEQLEARIDLLGLAATPERYATLTHALDVRFHNASIDYATMLQDDLSPGQIVAATIVAADTKTTPEAVVAEAAAGHRSIIELANERGMSTFALKVFMGLILLDYTDDPEKEARPLT
jgi:predicted Zn-dependent protease